ncbi:fibroblast growth factor receptor 4-like [Daktulosphaira vitifoliae]|uniref:fibroblast growth factor receptor 4-like n=1 Tax=Daktulosphaira vitifoliae TaxID=58002 RepID=UPI0021AA1FB6|nr:fibroblast growth factor receptor 4-like [Daktulosphaira vitifoliae]
MHCSCITWCKAFLLLFVLASSAAQLVKDEWMVILPSGIPIGGVRNLADHRRQRNAIRIAQRRTTIPTNQQPRPSTLDVPEEMESGRLHTKKKTKYKRMWDDEMEVQASEVQNITTKRPDRIKTRRRLVPASSTVRAIQTVIVQEDPYFDFGKKIRHTSSTTVLNVVDLQTRTSMKSPVILSTTEDDRFTKAETETNKEKTTERISGVSFHNRTQQIRNSNNTTLRRPETQTVDCAYQRYTRRNKYRSQRDIRCMTELDSRATRILSTVVTSVSVKGKNDTNDELSESSSTDSATPSSLTSTETPGYPKYLRNRYGNISLPEYLEITKINQRRLNATSITSSPKVTFTERTSSINASSYAPLQNSERTGPTELPTTNEPTSESSSPPSDLQDYIYLVNGTSESLPDITTKNAAIEAKQRRPIKNNTRLLTEHEVGVIYPEGLTMSAYLLTFLAIVPLILVIAFALKLVIQRKKKKVFDSSEYSSEYNRSPLDFNTITSSPLTTKLPRVPQHIVWDTEKMSNIVPLPNNSRWEFPREKLRLQTILGQGNFGQVWKAEADDISGHEGLTRLVAVKMVKEDAATREREDLIRELSIMQHLGSHPNVVTLLGCCTEKEPYLLIMEYVMYGKLLAFLRDRRTRSHYFNFSDSTASLTSRDLTMFAYCVARGMDFLGSKKIVHRDLAARNILVDHNKLCKIADFGMSRNVRDTNQIYEQRHTKGALPIRWMAPESLHYSIFTYKTDVWSFGVLMWEIVTLGSTPYCTMGAREVMRRVREGYRLEKPAHCRSELFRVITKCWIADPAKRPTFAELKQELAALLENPEFEGSYVDLESLVDESDNNKNKH